MDRRRIKSGASIQEVFKSTSCRRSRRQSLLLEDFSPVEHGSPSIDLSVVRTFLMTSGWSKKLIIISQAIRRTGRCRSRRRVAVCGQSSLRRVPRPRAQSLAPSISCWGARYGSLLLASGCFRRVEAGKSLHLHSAAQSGMSGSGRRRQ